jgi:hypothetical protein
MKKITSISLLTKKGKRIVDLKPTNEFKHYKDLIVRIMYQDSKDRRCTYFLSRPKYPKTVYLLDVLDLIKQKNYTPDPGICLTKREAIQACNVLTNENSVCTFKPVKIGSWRTSS